MRTKEEKAAFIVFLQALSYCLAISHGDTTLVPSIVPSIIAGLHYVFALLMIVFSSSRRNAVNTGLVYKLILVIVLFLLIYVNICPSESHSLINSIAIIPFIVFCFIDDVILYKAIVYFEKFMIFSAIVGIISYILCLIGIRPLLFPYYGSSGGLYASYLLSYVCISPETGMRLCGLFNEPGYFGTFAAFFIILNKCDLKKRGNKILLVASLLTFSLAFFVLFAVGLFAYKANNKKKLVFGIISAICVLFVLQNVQTGNVYIDTFLERFQFDKELGTFKGDNRGANSLELKAALDDFYKSDMTLFGYGTGYVKSQSFGSLSTPLSYLLDWGYVGMFLSYGLLSLFAIFLSIKNRLAMIFTICFILSIYQRPNVFTIAYFLLLFGGIVYCKRSSPLDQKNRMTI